MRPSGVPCLARCSPQHGTADLARAGIRCTACQRHSCPPATPDTGPRLRPNHHFQQPRERREQPPRIAPAARAERVDGLGTSPTTRETDENGRPQPGRGCWSARASPRPPGSRRRSAPPSQSRPGPGDIRHLGRGSGSSTSPPCPPIGPPLWMSRPPNGPPHHPCGVQSTAGGDTAKEDARSAAAHREAQQRMLADAERDGRGVRLGLGRCPPRALARVPAHPERTARSGRRGPENPGHRRRIPGCRSKRSPGQSATGPQPTWPIARPPMVQAGAVVMGRILRRVIRASRGRSPGHAKRPLTLPGNGLWRWWGYLDLNQRPLPYQGSALTD